MKIIIIIGRFHACHSYDASLSGNWNEFRVMIFHLKHFTLSGFSSLCYNKTNSLEAFYIWWRKIIYSCKKRETETKHVHCSHNNTHHAIKLNINWNVLIFYFLHQNCHLQAGPRVYSGIKRTSNHNKLNSFSQFWCELMDMRCDTTIEHKSQIW